MLSKPVILDGVMFRARGHALGLQAGKGEGTNVILMNFDVHVGDRRNVNPHCGPKLTNQVDDREQVFQEVPRATYPASMVDRAISVWSLDFQSTGQLKSVMRYPVQLQAQ